MNRLEYLLIRGLILPVSAMIAAYIILGGYNRLLADDYCSLYFAERLGLLRSIWYWYLNWHGGFSASAFDWLLSVVGPYSLRYSVFFFLSVWLCILFLLFRRIFSVVFDEDKRSFTDVLLSLLLISVVLLISPDLSQSLFWWGGVRAYLFPLILFTLYILLFLKFFQSNPTSTGFIGWCLVSFALSFVNGGFSEVFTPVQVVIFICITFLGWWVGKFEFRNRVFQFLLAGAAGSCLALIVMVLAPGNANRQEYFSATPGLFDIFAISIKGYSSFLWSVMSTPALLSGILCLTVAAFYVGTGFTPTPKAGDHKDLQWACIALGIGCILAFGCFIPPAYGISDVAPARTLIIPSFFFVAGVFAFGLFLGRYTSIGFLKDKRLSVVLVALCWVTILLPFKSVYTYFVVAHKEHVSFAEKWDRVDSQIRLSIKNEDQDIHIPSMKNWAGLEYPNDNPKYWPNVCFSIYYKINVLAPPLE